MIFSISHTSKRFDFKGKMWVRRHWRIHLLLFVIPLWIDNWKTEYVYANGKPIEEMGSFEKERTQ